VRKGSLPPTDEKGEGKDNPEGRERAPPHRSFLIKGESCGDREESGSPDLAARVVGGKTECGGSVQRALRRKNEIEKKGKHRLAPSQGKKRSSAAIRGLEAARRAWTKGGGSRTPPSGRERQVRGVEGRLFRTNKGLKTLNSLSVGVVKEETCS